jgi:hypothetical protein
MKTHDKLTFQACFKFSRPRPNIKSFSLRYAAHLSPSIVNRSLTSHSALPVSLARAYFSLLEANETRMPRLRNFDTEPPSSYCYEFQSDNRLESVAYAHTAADLHVHPVFLNRAGLKSRGRRERLKKYTMRNFSQRI